MEKDEFEQMAAEELEQFNSNLDSRLKALIREHPELGTRQISYEEAKKLVEPKTMGDMTWTCAPPPQNDEELRWWAALEGGFYPTRAMATELLVLRDAMRKLRDLAWHPTQHIQNVNHYRKVLVKAGYEGQE